MAVGSLRLVPLYQVIPRATLRLYSVRRSHIFGLCKGWPMNNPRTSLVTFAALLTVGIALMVLHIPWVSCIGLGLIVVARRFSSRVKSRGDWVLALYLYGTGTAVFLAWGWLDGSILHGSPPRKWYVIVLLAVGLLALANECFRWRKGRGETS